MVIPTLNAGPGFEELLKGLSKQETSFGYEVLVIDSGSTDGTAELARRHGATVHAIPRAEFGHGATRNLGVSLSRGEYVAFIVQDAVPLDGRWLAAMVEDLEGDELVAGVYGRRMQAGAGDHRLSVLMSDAPCRNRSRSWAPLIFMALRPPRGSSRRSSA